jgi:hypothetical protein
MYIDGHLSWIFRRDYNDRRELIHMEDAFYGDGFFFVTSPLLRISEAF